MLVYQTVPPIIRKPPNWMHVLKPSSAAARSRCPDTARGPTAAAPGPRPRVQRLRDSIGRTDPGNREEDNDNDKICEVARVKF